MYDIYRNAKVTGHFGEKRSYYKPGKYHEGDDIALAMNTPINAILGGTIVGVKSDPNGYGNYVDIDHGNGIVTRYAHANSFNVKPGQKVKEGEQIGLVGSTGRSSGPHLHLEAMINGIKRNPRELGKYMQNINVLKPKGTMGTPNVQDIEALANDYAMSQVPQAGLQLSPEEREAKNQTLSYLLNKINTPVEMPRFTTIQDIVNAPKGEKLKTFGEYVENNPDVTRLIGSFLGGTRLDTARNRFVHSGEEQARRQEAQMQAAQERALDEMKAQSALANAMYGSFADRELAAAKDALEREQMAQRFKLENDKREWETTQKELDRQFEKEENEKNRQNNIKIAKERGTNGGASFSNITTVRKEFNSIPAIKNYGEIRRQYNNVAAVKKKFENIKGKTKYNANDQTLITTFNKILDPTSVVRESEFARTAEGQGLIDKIQGAANKMVKGGSGLSASERQDVFDAIEAMYQAQEQEAQRYIQFYSELATRYGINPDDIVGGIGLRNISSNTKPKAKAPKGKLVL